MFITKVVELAFKALFILIIPLVISLLFSLNWPIYKIGTSSYMYLTGGAFYFITILMVIKKGGTNERGYKKIIKNAETKIGGFAAILFAPVMFSFVAGFSATTLDHWQLKIFANEKSSVKVKIIRLDNNKFNWFTWKARVEILDAGNPKNLYLSKDMVSDHDIGKCLKLSGRQNDYGLYIEQKTYISCDLQL